MRDWDVGLNTLVESWRQWSERARADKDDPKTIMSDGYYSGVEAIEKCADELEFQLRMVRDYEHRQAREAGRR